MSVKIALFRMVELYLLPYLHTRICLDALDWSFETKCYFLGR